METRTIDEIKKDSKLLQLFYFLLKELYMAEKKQIREIPRLMESVDSGELKIELAHQLQQTSGHVYRLRRIFSLSNMEAHEGNCRAIVGLFKEADELIDHTEECTAQRDAGIITIIQKIEHYEIASYNGLIEIAKTLKLADITDLLKQNLNEEKIADENLIKLATGYINDEASKEPALDE